MVGEGIGELGDVLAERDRRAAVRRGVFTRREGTVDPVALVQLAPVAPAVLRDDPAIAALCARGARRFEDASRAQGWEIRAIDCRATALGRWYLWSVASSAATPERIKYLCVGLEDEGPPGRFWDFDVEGPAGPVGRADLGIEPRACVVCGGIAAVCSGRRSHAMEQVLRAFRRLADSAGAPSPKGQNRHGPPGRRRGTRTPMHEQTNGTRRPRRPRTDRNIF